MADDQAIREALWAAAAPFATAPPPRFALVYAPLFRALAPEAAPDPYVLAIELVYEGYLTHYRVSRLLGANTTLQTRLLAGDHLDASGLRLVADAGDLDSIALLTRLMATCSWLRAEDCPFACDDDLWALCVAGMASSASGGSGLAALRVFDEVGALFGRGRAERLPQVVRRAAASLSLRRPQPLRAALGMEHEVETDAQHPGSDDAGAAGAALTAMACKEPA